MAADAQDAPAVWDADYVGVWHMADGGDATGHNASTNNGATVTAGKIGSALQFAGADAHVDTMNTDHLTRWTIELWMNPASNASATGCSSSCGDLLHAAESGVYVGYDVRVRGACGRLGLHL